MSPESTDTTAQADDMPAEGGADPGAQTGTLAEGAAAEQTADPAAAPAFEDSEHEGSPLGEHIMQRLRYFENLVEHQFAHLKALADMLTRHGAAAPALPHFPELKSPIGDFNPNNRA